MLNWVKHEFFYNLRARSVVQSVLSILALKILVHNEPVDKKKLHVKPMHIFRT